MFLAAEAGSGSAAVSIETLTVQLAPSSGFDLGPLTLTPGELLPISLASASSTLLVRPYVTVDRRRRA